MGQDDKGWSVLNTPLVDWKEMWWVTVMGVGLDPELTKWSMHSGLAIVLTGKGYKEHHWLVVPPSTTSVISTVIVTVVWHDFRLTLSLFLLSPTLHPHSLILSFSLSYLFT